MKWRRGATEKGKSRTTQREVQRPEKKGRRPLHSLALSVPNHHPPPPHTHNPAALTFHRCPPPPHRQISASLLARPPICSKRSDTSHPPALALESHPTHTPLSPATDPPQGSWRIKHTQPLPSNVMTIFYVDASGTLSPALFGDVQSTEIPDPAPPRPLTPPYTPHSI
jgi:hypothetical protein